MGRRSGLRQDSEGGAGQEPQGQGKQRYNANARHGRLLSEEKRMISGTCGGPDKRGDGRRRKNARPMCNTKFQVRTAGLAAAFLCAAVLGACNKQPASPGRRGGGGPAVPIHTTAVQRMAVQRQVDLAGTLLSPDQARVSSETAGIVRSVLIEIGREVRAGDPLVKL